MIIARFFAVCSISCLTLAAVMLPSALGVF